MVVSSRSGPSPPHYYSKRSELSIAKLGQTPINAGAADPEHLRDGDRSHSLVPQLLHLSLPASGRWLSPPVFACGLRLSDTDLLTLQHHCALELGDRSHNLKE